MPNSPMPQAAYGPFADGWAAPPGNGNGSSPGTYTYRFQEVFEPDWRRLPGWKDVTVDEWESAQWQRAHCIKSTDQLKAVMGDLLPDFVYADLARDQAEYASMRTLLTPQLLNTMVPDAVPDADAFYADPLRRYMLPVASDRAAQWASHPLASRGDCQRR